MPAGNPGLPVAATCQLSSMVTRRAGRNSGVSSTAAAERRVFPGPDCGGEIYLDDGVTFAYRHGEFLRMKFTCTVSSDKSELAIHLGKHEGDYPAWWKDVAVEVAGLTKSPATATATVNGNRASLVSGERGDTLTVPDPGTGIEIVIRQ